MTAGRAGALVALVLLVFGAAYLLTSSSGSARTTAPSTVRKLSFPAPEVAVPATDSEMIPPLERPPRPAAPPPGPATPPPASPQAPPPPGGGGSGGGGGIIQG
jgi:hypothetical protein